MKLRVVLPLFVLLAATTHRPTAIARNPAPAAIQLAGTVTSASAGTPLKDVIVRLLGTSIGGLTDVRGRYLLLLPDSLDGEEVEVAATLIGFGEVRKKVALTDTANVLDFELHSQATHLEGMVIGAPVEQQRTAVVAAHPRRDAARRVSVAAEVVLTRRALSRTVPEGEQIEVAAPPGSEFDREGYDRIYENPFKASRQNPLSTFSIDVDRASYSNVRRFLKDGRRPPPDAVRIEELVNYFSYDDPAPGPDEPPFRITTEVAPAPWQPAHHLVRIGLKAREVDMGDTPPSNLVFLVDVSGSMGSPDKLPLLKTALTMLVEQLRSEDRVAIVGYAGAADVVLESTPGSEKETILRAVDGLQAGGSTAGGAGIELAYRIAAENHVPDGTNRVLLATDGDFNVGVSSEAGLTRLIEEKRTQGTFLTVLGFGRGNYQDAKMEQLADHGNGNFAYVDGELEARKVLVHEMGGTLLTVAKDVKIQVEFNPARVRGYRLVGYENRLLAAEDFSDDTKDAGELGAGHSVTALYEVVPVGAESSVEIRGLDTSLRYQDVEPRVGSATGDELLYVKLRWKEPEGETSEIVDHPVLADDVARSTTDDFRWSAAVAAWGMVLRGSEHCNGWRTDDVERLARGAVGPDPNGYRKEFLELVAISERFLEREVVSN